MGYIKLTLPQLLEEVRQCQICADNLPLGPRPVLSLAASAKILLIGQAPGTRVHKTGIPWNDPSGDRLRQWLNLDRDIFYDATKIAIMPMGFCYPGKGQGGDLPPRPECAPLWHQRLLAHLPEIELTLLIGNYAVRHYLNPARNTPLKNTIANWQTTPKPHWPLPHPSPRNTKYLRNLGWFETEMLPQLRERVREVLRL